MFPLIFKSNMLKFNNSSAAQEIANYDILDYWLFPVLEILTEVYKGIQ